MKSLRTILVITLILSGLIPLPVAMSSLFSPANAGAAINLTGITTDVHQALILNGSYMLSFIVMFWLAAVWLMKNKPGGNTLALALGIITLLRGLLLLLTYNVYDYETTIVAYVAIVDGLVIGLLSIKGTAKTGNVAI